MTTVVLGQEPVGLLVNLFPDTDFVATLRTKDGSDFGVGVFAELVFDGLTTWTALAVDDTIVFDETEVAVNALIALNPQRVRLYWNQGTTRLVWLIGRPRVWD